MFRQVAVDELVDDVVEMTEATVVVGVMLCSDYPEQVERNIKRSTK
jgi:hypothetical protein